MHSWGKFEEYKGASVAAEEPEVASCLGVGTLSLALSWTTSLSENCRNERGWFAWKCSLSISPKLLWIRGERIFHLIHAHTHVHIHFHTCTHASTHCVLVIRGSVLGAESSVCMCMWGGVVADTKSLISWRMNSIRERQAINYIRKQIYDVMSGSDECYEDQ